jgi:GNAT superfamily N-acetyltransferase
MVLNPNIKMFNRVTNYLKTLCFFALFLGVELYVMEITRGWPSQEDYWFAEALIKNDLQCFTYQKWGSDYSLEVSIEYLRNKNAQTNTVTKACFYNGERVGFITYVPNMDAVTGQSIIVLLAVAEEFRRRGCGRELLNYALRGARAFGSNRVIVSVKRGNKGAIEFIKNVDLRIAKYVLLEKR